VSCFHTLLSLIGHPDKKINKETSEVSMIIDQIHSADIYRTLHTTVPECTFFSSAHRTFSKIDILGLKQV
jgi:hypothetical protein